MHILNVADLSKWLKDGKEMIGWVKPDGMSGYRFIPTPSNDVGPFTDQMWVLSPHPIPPITAVEKLVKGAAVKSVRAMFVVTQYGIYRLVMLGNALNDGRVIHGSRIHSPINMYSNIFSLLTGSASKVPIAAAIRAVKKLASYNGIGMEYHPVDYTKDTWTMVPIDSNHHNWIQLLMFIIGIGVLSLFGIWAIHHR